jgi:SOS-response transcriptional repressor LexA
VLEAIEAALSLEPGQLVRIAEWQTTPPAVQAEYRQLLDELTLAGRRADGAMNLDALYRSGKLQRGVERSTPNVEPVKAPFGQVPLINKVAAGYPTDFTDLEYPARVADEYVAAPGLGDPEAFAARVVGESMLPEYREGDLLIFSPAREPVDGADCFVRLLPDHHTTFKRVFFEEGERVRLVPLNAAFAVRTVTVQEISGMYPAVMRIQRLGAGG